MAQPTTDDALVDYLDQAEDEGRGTDTTIAHLTVGEAVIPEEMMEELGPLFE